MRKDMSKVVTERPRAGGGTKRRCRLTQTELLTQASEDDEEKDLPLEGKEGMRKVHTRHPKASRKSFTDHLNPLKRFLNSKVGNIWDNVYSEVCEQLKGTSTTLIHIKDHVHDYVSVNATKDEAGKLYGHSRSGYRHPIYDGNFYVDDKGYLRLHKEKKPKKDPKEKNPPYHWVFKRISDAAKECRVPLDYEGGKLLLAGKDPTTEDADAHIDLLYPKVTKFPDPTPDPHAKYSWQLRWRHQPHPSPFATQWHWVSKDINKIKHPYLIRLNELIDQRFQETLKERKNEGKG